MRMHGTKQLECEAQIDAPVAVVYELFMDNRELPNWAPVVDAVIAEEPGDESGAGCTRTCAVTMGGRTGTMVEQCVEAVRNSRASFAVIDDTFGFHKMLRDYAFTAHFRSVDAGTAVRIETFYTPANPLAIVLNRLVMRRKFRAVLNALLTGLSSAAEQRHHPGASAGPLGRPRGGA